MNKNFNLGCDKHDDIFSNLIQKCLQVIPENLLARVLIPKNEGPVGEAPVEWCGEQSPHPPPHKNRSFAGAQPKN